MCGVYMIKNKINGKFYIGSSVDIQKRWINHRVDLRNNKHHSFQLQQDWSEYGEDNFEFLILEECDVIDIKLIREREQYYLDFYRSYNNNIGYNIYKVSIGTSGGELAPCFGRTGDKHPLWGHKGKDAPFSKSVICINTGEVFDSATEASQWAKCNHSKLCMCCRGERKSCGQLNGERLKWKYLNNYLKESENNDDTRNVFNT